MGGAGAEPGHDVLGRITALSADPPAIANVLVHGGTPSGDVLAATLLDLAARGHVGLELRSGDVHFYRSPNPPAGGAEEPVLPFEALVLELMHEHLVDGPVPASSVTLGIEDEADAWGLRFRTAVVDDARRRRYLSRWKVGAALAGIVLLAAATLAAMIYASARDESDVAMVVALVAFGAFAIVGYAADGVDSWVGLSRAGRVQAGQWTQVRHALAGVGGFAPVPAGAVAVWGPHLAYAVALGLAPQAAADLPLGPDPGSRAWVHRRGEWHQVRIRAPWWLPPGWGRPPWVTALVGLGVATVSGAVLLGAVSGGGGAARWFVAGGAVVGMLWGASLLGLAVADAAASPVEVAGPVVAVRAEQPPVGPWRDWFPVRYTIVVDDGAAPVLTPLRIREGDVERVRRGGHVRVACTRRLRHVVTLDVG